MAEEWIARAHSKYKLHTFPWRAYQFVASEHRDSVNETMEKAGHGPGNLSVPMSRDGRDPPTHFGMSGIWRQEEFERILEALHSHPGSVSFIGPHGAAIEEPRELLAVYGLPASGLIGRLVTFDICAEFIGIRKVRRDYLFPGQQAELLLQTIVTPGTKVPEGWTIAAVALPWFAILSEIEKDPAFLFKFARHARKFEEFLAGAYEREGYEVILTPQRNDQGRDVIATKRGFGSIRILDQAKAYSPGHLVTHDDVRGMLGVLSTNQNASKGIITTTSDFQPGVLSGAEFKPFLPFRLDLKNGDQLREWLSQLRR